MNRRRRAALSWVAIAAIAAVVLVGAVLRSNRFSVAEVDVAPGTAWLALVASGEAMLVNGGSGEVALRVAVAEPGSPLEVVQHGDGAIVLDKEGATLQTVSARSFEPTGVTPIGSVPDSLVPGERTVHVTTDEAILTFDPATLEPTGEVALAGELDALVDRDERLWVLDHGNDALHRVEGDEIAESLDPGELGAAAALTLVDDRPVVVDPASATITVVDDDGLGPAVEVGALAPGGDVLVVEPRPGVELPAILMIVPEEGRYLACDVDAPARCEDLTFGGAGDSFGPPQYVDDRLFVPDRTTGRVVVIDTRRNEHITTTTVLREPTQQLELVATDDLVWFNNLGGSEAGVLDENGEVRRVVRKLGDDVELTDDALGEGDGEGTIERRDGGVGDDVAPDDASGDEADDAGTDTSDTSDAVDDGAADGTDTTTGVDDGG
ncbi:MAG: hypothetical protein S0880_32625, partial [Actinomycetota bacterium]|nr:hypothetical protein [Actinomycetota bacterium]